MSLAGIRGTLKIGTTLLALQRHKSSVSSPKSHRLRESISDRRPSLLTTRAAELSILLHTERQTGSHSLPERILGRFFVFCEEQYYDKATPSDLVAL